MLHSWHFSLTVPQVLHVSKFSFKWHRFELQPWQFAPASGSASSRAVSLGQPASQALQGSCTWLLDTWGCRELALEGRSSEDSGSAWSRGGSLSQPSRRQPFWPATAHFLRQNTCLYIINVCFVKKNWTNLTFYMAEGTFSSLAPWICGQRISRRLAIKTFDGLSLLCFYIHHSNHWI